MEYIDEVSAFYEGQHTTQLTPSATLVWFALLYIRSQSGWPDYFSVPVRVLTSFTQLNSKSVERARHELQRAGLLDWTSRSGRQSAVYSLRTLRDKFGVQNVAQNNFRDKFGVQNVAQNNFRDKFRVQNVAQNNALHPENVVQTETSDNLPIDKRSKDLNTSSSSSLEAMIRGEFMDAFGRAPKQSQLKAIYERLEQGADLSLVFYAINESGIRDKDMAYALRIIDNNLREGVTTFEEVRNKPQDAASAKSQVAAADERYERFMQTYASTKG